MGEKYEENYNLVDYKQWVGLYSISCPYMKNRKRRNDIYPWS